MPKVECTCTSQWEISARCPVHGYIKPSTICAEDLFLKQLPVRKPRNVDIEELLYEIIERAKIGCDVAILSDESQNFQWIIELAQMALEKNKA